MPRAPRPTTSHSASRYTHGAWRFPASHFPSPRSMGSYQCVNACRVSCKGVRLFHFYYMISSSSLARRMRRRGCGCGCVLLCVCMAVLSNSARRGDLSNFAPAGLSISSIGICWDPLQILMVLQGASLYNWEIAATTLDSCLRVALSVNKR